MATSARDTALWLHNKLGATDDLWAPSSVTGLLTPDTLYNTRQCFLELQVPVKLKLLLALVHLPRRQLQECSASVEHVISQALQDDDAWVRMIADVVRSYPKSGALNTHLEDTQSVYGDTVENLRGPVSEVDTSSLLPLECKYLNRNALNAMLGQQPPPVKHFALKRKPKSATLRAELLQKSSEAALQQKKGVPSTPIPGKARTLSVGRRIDTTTPLKGIPKSFTASSHSGFHGSSATGGRSVARLAAMTASRKGERGAKFLEIEEQPLGGQAKRRKRMQDETQEKQKQKEEKEKEEAATATPDYAAGLLAAAATAQKSAVPVTTIEVTAPSYAPSTAMRTNTPGNAPATQTTTSAVPNSVAAARENLQQQLQQQLQAPQFSAQPTLQQPQQPQPTLQQPAGLQYEPPAAAAAQSTSASASQSQQKKGLSLTREQMLAAQEMFRTSNKVTRPEKALILGFMAGSRENPCPQQGDSVTIKLSEHTETVPKPDGTGEANMVVDTLFEMNYKTGEWKRLKKYRPTV
ncbi:negative elongation factor A-like [Branchiostoma floridae]|uniref:Negative elongation factor A-like n=1 Tax=Branchiostoma floridae TaxID=7739 RepID=A0A9J7HXQ7_BRAFL|nr:negative elongation factor A-like [Branchiostoma floridae]